MRDLRQFTSARVALGRAGNSLPTREVLRFSLAHAQARDAVQFPFDAAVLRNEIEAEGWPALALNSAVGDRAEYLRRPDLGRRLDAASKAELGKIRGSFDVVFAVVDGLSALAVHKHAVGVLRHVIPQLGGEWSVAPVAMVRFGRVAIGDDIGAAIGARLSVVLIGERPGLSTPDSLGIYLTWNPQPVRSDADRNCISNIHAEGLSVETGALLLGALMREARTRKLSGVMLKAPALSSLNKPDPLDPGGQTAGSGRPEPAELPGPARLT